MKVKGNKLEKNGVHESKCKKNSGWVLGTIPKNTEKRLDQQAMKGIAETIQNVFLLILARSVLQTKGTCCNPDTKGKTNNQN